MKLEDVYSRTDAARVLNVEPRCIDILYGVFKDNPESVSDIAIDVGDGHVMNQHGKGIRKGKILIEYRSEKKTSTDVRSGIYSQNGINQLRIINGGTIDMDYDKYTELRKLVFDIVDAYNRRQIYKS